ncbi:hypothetical protein WJX72_010979 [[Myrmecia] bisecta]|uniref:Class I SAM-dependent methyltransferase n=1 Tax=[Myrmecia] bisecta TaxID=41462 RepID=A0AAW1R9H7_9CHLO
MRAWGRSSETAWALGIAVVTSLAISHTGCNQEQGVSALQKRFEDIYATGIWGGDEHGGRSGGGSTIEFTESARTIVRLVVNLYNIQSMVDTPCGAMVWTPHVLNVIQADDVPSFRYLGGDIVRPVVQANRAKFKDKPNWTFEVFDFTKDPIPDGYDLIFNRDVLQHLSCDHIVDALQNFARSNARYLLVGQHKTVESNLNVEDGQFFFIDLRMAPFHLVKPTRVFEEYVGHLPPDVIAKGCRKPEACKLLMLYEIQYLKQIDYAAMRQGCASIPAKPKGHQRHPTNPAGRL